MNELIVKDLKHIWHPCAQMKEFESTPPLIIHSAQGSYLKTNQGQIIDAISSWWCKSLGHRHPAIIAAIQQQMMQFEHVITANTTYPALADLGEKLAKLSHKQHVFFASDGSSAVEIAMKLALHAKQLQGKPHQRNFIALQNSYHGETLATLSVSDLGLYKKPYDGFGVHCHFIDNIPYVTGTNDPLWHDCEAFWSHTLAELETIKEHSCAILVEPLIQGACGMRCYSADFLARLARWAKANDIYLIADEIMTGVGRTGKWFASQHAAVEPDLICLSKGLSSGSLALSCVLIDHALFDLFYDDYDQGKSFLHSHTYSGNALAVSAALAALRVIEAENLNQRATELGQLMTQNMHQIAAITSKLRNVRSLGAMVAADYDDLNDRRLLKRFEQLALKNGALLRPIGQTLYWLPPLTTDDATLVRLAEITLKSIHEL